MTNLFSNAKANPTKSAKAIKEEIPFVKTPGFEILAQIDALEKHLAALKKTTLRPEIQDYMIDQFLETKGESYDAKEGNATGKMILGKRASNSGLKDSEIELCKTHNISTLEIEGDFKLNVEGLTPKKLQEVSDALSKIKGLPEKFIEFDASKARTIVTETSLDEVFKINDQDTIRELLPVVGIFTIKPKTADSMTTVLEAVTKLVCPAPVKKAK